jgi:hypothetical protein
LTILYTLESFFFNVTLHKIHTAWGPFAILFVLRLLQSALSFFFGNETVLGGHYSSLFFLSTVLFVLRLLTICSHFFFWERNGIRWSLFFVIRSQYRIITIKYYINCMLGMLNKIFI